MRSFIHICLSVVFPGLGHLVAGRLFDAVLFLYASLWVRLFIVGQAAPDERLAAFFLGAPAITGGLRAPVLVVFTGLLAAMHALATWHAMRLRDPPTAPRQPAPNPKGSGEVDSDLAP